LNSLLYAFSAELLTVLSCNNFSNPDINRKNISIHLDFTKKMDWGCKRVHIPRHQAVIFLPAFNSKALLVFPQQIMLWSPARYTMPSNQLPSLEPTCCTGWAQKTDTLSVAGFTIMLDALYLQFLFTHVLFSLDDAILRLPM